MKFRFFQFVVAVIVTVILMHLSLRWNLEWYKVSVLYFLGVVAMLIISGRPKTTAAEVLERMQQQLEEDQLTQPLSANDVIDYIKSCTDYCRDNNI